MKAEVTKTPPNPFNDGPNDAYEVRVELTSKEIATFLEKGRITLGNGTDVTLKLIEVETHQPDDKAPKPKPPGHFPTDMWLDDLKEYLKNPSPFVELERAIRDAPPNIRFNPVD